MKPVTVGIVLLLSGSVFLPHIGNAKPVEGDRASVSLGVFITDRKTRTRLDSDTGIGTEITLEDDLGVDSSDNVFRVDSYYRFNERHRLDLSAFDLSRENVRAISRDITWGDELYTIGTVIKTNFDLKIYKGAYTYSFVDRDTSYIGASIGLYVADIDISLTEQNVGRLEVGSITAPLPVIGLRGSRDLTDRWSVKGSSELFFLEVDDTNGSLVDLLVGVDYALTNRISLGAAYNFVHINVDTESSNLKGSLDWKYKGGMLYLQARY